MKSILNYLFLSLFAISFLTSCANDDSYAIPDMECNEPNLVSNVTIDSLTKISTDKPILFTGKDAVISGYVVSSDKEKAFYQQIYMVDDKNEKAFVVSIQGSNHFAAYSVGRKVNIKLDGLYTQLRNGILQVGELYGSNVGNILTPNIKNHVFRSCNSIKQENEMVQSITLDDAIASDQYVGHLIELKEVQFVQSEIGQYYADQSQNGTDRNLISKTGKTTIFRTSKQTLFASKTIPNNSGKVRGVLTKFGSTFQFVARYYSDIQLTESPFKVGEEPGEPGTEPEVTGVLAFPGSDFENWDTFKAQLTTHGLKDYAKQGMNLGMKNSNALSLAGTPTANEYVFTTQNVKNVPVGATKIAFYIKGTSSTKSLSINVYKKNGTNFEAFNFGSLTTSKTIQKAPENTTSPGNGSNDYVGVINTNGNWIKVTLDLTGVEYNTTGVGSFIAVKTGSGSIYDLAIDNIMIEGGQAGENPDPEPEPEPGKGATAFPGGDFEDWTAFENGLLSLNGAAKLKDYATQQTGKGVNNSTALGLIGTPAGNDYVFTTEKVISVPANATKLSFMVKGTAGKSLSFNVYKSDGTTFTAFNVGDLASTDVTIASAANNQYTGTINTAGKWVKVTLNIAGLDYNKTGLKSFLALKVGKDVAYDLYLDNFIIE